ncbi:MAG: response regulator transcription factor [Gemmatimonadota bacterium]|nr:response regulator transcription factor [Gemmatimonadota bacterium]
MDAGTTVVLADPHAMVREGLRLALEATGRMTVVGETGCTEEAVRISSRAKPDVLAIGFQGRRGRTLWAIRKLRAGDPGTNVLVLTDSERNESLDGIIESGARGCIGKDRTAGDLVIAVDLVAAGRMRLPRQASRLVRRRVVTNGSGAEARLARLSEKERRIVVLTARGFTSKEIGRRVFMTAKSVDNARGRVRRKLELKTRAELIAFADKAGLLEGEA